jgi:hypothetical protein
MIVEAPVEANESVALQKPIVVFSFSPLFFFAVLLYFLTARRAAKLFAANEGKSKAPGAAI